MEFSDYAFFLDELTKERKLYFVENPAETPISNCIAIAFWLESITPHQEDMSSNPLCGPTRCIKGIRPPDGYFFAGQLSQIGTF